MISALAARIAEALCASATINKDEESLYQYGFALLLSHLFYFAITALFGLLLHVFWESVIFYIMFSFLRSYAGGIHSRSETICMALTIVTFIISIIAIRLLKEHFSIVISAILSIVGTTCIVAFAPLDSPEKQLDEYECRYYRKISCAVCFAILLLSILFYICKVQGITGASTVSLAVEGFLLVVGKRKITRCSRN